MSQTVEIEITEYSPDSGIKINQMGLMVAILKELGNQYPGIGLLPRHTEVILRVANQIRDEFAKPEIKATPNIGIDAWLQTDHTGQSSLYMAFILSGGHNSAFSSPPPYAYPLDPQDFGRCLGLLGAAPELRERVSDMMLQGREWAGLIAHWDELETLYLEESPSGHAPKLYDRMREILGPIEKGDQS